MERREVLGNVVKTELAAAINNSAMSFTVLDGSTFPTGSVNPFVVVINRGLLNEEKILISSRTGDTFAVLQRGYDGVPSSSHATGAGVDHVLDAFTIQDMNKTTYDNHILYWVGA
jgi:hypothetical protein